MPTAMRRRPDPGVTALVSIAAYNVVQNLVIPERSYTPANLAATVGLVAQARRSGVTGAELGLVAGDAGRALVLGGGVVAATAAALAATARSRRLSTVLLDERARGHDRREALSRVLVRFPLGTALFEEVAFRGVLQALFARRLGHARATVFTSAAFGIWHVLPTLRLHRGMAGGRPDASRVERVAVVAGSVAATTASGFVFDSLRRRSGTLLAPWLAHLGVGALPYLAARRAWRGQPS